MKKLRIIFIILTIIWMIGVFCFSNQPSDESKNTSLFITEKIADIIYGDNLTSEEREIKIEELDYIIRKLAHYTLYTLGGILIFMVANTYNATVKIKLFVSQIIGSIYAITDEFHQYFVPGRSAQIKDVIIDSLGVFSGMILMLILIKLCSIIKKYIRSKERGIPL